MFLYKNILVILLLCAINGVGAQEVPLGILTKQDAGQVKLKILPKDAHHWLLGIDNGYVISRKDLNTDEDFMPIHSGVIKPASESEWPQDERGREMYSFHSQALEKIRSLRGGESFLESFKLAQRANSNYKMYAFITMRDKDFGDYSGLEFKDENVSPDKLYAYRVSIADTDVHSKSTVMDSHEFANDIKLDFSNQEKSVRLSWIHDENTPVIGYYLERSETGLKYERINDGPILPNSNNTTDTIGVNHIFEVHKIDSLYKNYQPHYYRLIALDAWGDESNPSFPVVAMGIDKTAPRLGDFMLQADTAEHIIRVRWEPSKDTDVVSYFITKSYRLNGIDSVIVQGILPSDDLIYEIENPIEMQNHYIKIGAVDTSGNAALSESKAIFLPDNTPPSTVENLSYTLDSSGIVKLEWDPSYDSNFKGYWVYRSFNENKEYIKITDTVWTSESIIDTCSLSLLNNKRYYYIEALDNSFNQSTPSEVITVTLPDTIPPSITYIEGVQVGVNGLNITWGENQSDDVASYLVYKQVSKDDWKMIGKVPSNILLYNDTTAHEKVNVYQILAMDDSGNVASRGRPYSYSQQNTSLEKLSINIENVGDEVAITWNDIGSAYKLYRSSGENFKLLSYLQSASYKDENQGEGSKVSYYIKAYDEKGALITTSEIINH